MTEYEKKVLMHKELEEFRNAFYTKFEVRLSIGISIEYIDYKEDLEFLEQLGNQILKQKGIFNKYPQGIRTKSRERSLVLIRSCIFKVASGMGYGHTEIGRYFGFNHSTIIHCIKLVNDLSDIMDEEVLKLVIYIKNECKNKPRNATDIKSNN